MHWLIGCLERACLESLDQEAKLTILKEVLKYSIFSLSFNFGFRFGMILFAVGETALHRKNFPALICIKRVYTLFRKQRLTCFAARRPSTNVPESLSRQNFLRRLSGRISLMRPIRSNFGCTFSSPLSVID